MSKNKKTKLQSPQLPNLVAQIISPQLKHLANFTLQRMSRVELAALKKVVKGTVPVDEGADMGKAILALAQRESSATVAKILGDFLSNKNASRNDKVIAANSLAQMPSSAAERILLENLNTKDMLLRNSIYRSLGAVGGKDTLTKLKRFPSPKSLFLKKQLNFSKALIAHRIDDPKVYLRFEKGVERRANRNTPQLDFSVQAISKEKIRLVINSLSSINHYSLRISKTSGAEITAGNATWIFLVNKEVEGKKAFTNFTKRKHIVGLLARKNKSHNHYAIQYVVLSNPKAREVKLMVVRTDGELSYSGNAIIRNEAIQLSVQDIDRLGTMPTNIQGHLTSDGFKIRKSIVLGKRKKKKGDLVSVPISELVEV